MESVAPSHPGVRYPPPLLFVGGFAIGWLLHRMYPLPLLPIDWLEATSFVGWAVIVAGAVVLLWAVASFRRARTGIIPNRPATMLVLGGPYRFTRNPMYLGFASIYLGAGLLINSIWPLLMLPVLLLILYRTVIKREERYLSATFGDEYQAYCAQVRRWL